MRKKIVYLSMIATMVLFAACSNEDVLPEAKQTISFTASMPDEPTTRVDLVQESIGSNVKLSWKSGDIVKVAYVIESTQVKGTIEAVAGTISADGKTAKFDIPMPTGVTGNITLAGVYGGGAVTFDGNTPVVAMPTPTELANTGTLQSIQNEKHVMLYFKPFTYNIGTPAPAQTFSHIGSLFVIKVKNESSNPIPITSATLTRNSSTVGLGVGSGNFNLDSGEFTTSKQESISFKAPAISSSIPAGGTMELWGWYPTSTEDWGDSKLTLNGTFNDKNNDVLTIIESGGVKTGKVAEAGKLYYFYAEITENSDSGHGLQFTSKF